MPFPVDSLVNFYLSFELGPGITSVISQSSHLLPLCSAHTSKYLRGCFMLGMGQTVETKV